MPYAEVMTTPHVALAARLAALERARYRALAEEAELLAMVGEISWGQEVVGTMPTSKQDYKIVDTPFRRYLRNLRRKSEGLPEQELEVEKVERRKGVAKKMAAALLA